MDTNRNLTYNTMPGAFWRLDKNLVKLANAADYHGPDCALFFDDLVQQERYTMTNYPGAFARQGEYFYLQHKDSFERTGLSPHKQRRAMEFLQSFDFIAVTKRDIPAKTYYKINHAALTELRMGIPIESDYTTEIIGDDGYPLPPESPQLLKNLTTEGKKTLPVINKENRIKNKNVRDAASGAPVPKRKDKLRLSPIIPKRPPFPILPETEQLLAAWNALSDNPDLIVRPSRHRPGTGIISKIDQYVRILLSGKQKTELPLLQSWVTRSNLPTELLTKRFTVEDLLEGIRIHALHFQPDHWPFEASQKKSIPRSLEKALYSDNGKRTSWILFSLFAAAPKKKEAVKNPEAVKVLSNIVTRENNRPLKHSEEQQISTSADAIVAWHKRLAAGPLPYVLWYWMDIHTVEKFLNIFSAAIVIIQRERTIDIHPAMLRPGTVTWETFLTYLANEKKIDLTGYGEDPFEWVPQIVGEFNRARKVVEAMGPEKYHHIMTRRKEYPRFYLSEEVKEKVKKEYMEKLKAGKTKDKSFTQYALRKICKGEINVHR